MSVASNGPAENAGSAPILCSNKGNEAPNSTDKKTIMPKDKLTTALPIKS